MAPHRPLAGAAHPVGVRRGLRRDEPRRPRRGRLRLGPHAGEPPLLRARARRSASAWRRRATRSSRAAGRGSWRRPTGARARRAASRSGCNIELPHEQLTNAYCDLAHRLPLLLRAQDDVREVLRAPSSSSPAATGRSTSCSRPITLIQVGKVRRFPVVLMGDGDVAAHARLADVGRDRRRPPDGRTSSS